MKFHDAARIQESIRLGNSKREALYSIKEVIGALEVYSLFYPQKAMLSKGELASIFAKEVGVFVDVVLDILNEDSLSMALAQESSKSGSQGWSVPQAMRMMEGVANNAVSVLEASHKMDEIEARLFWAHVLGKRGLLTPRAFLICLGINNGVPLDVMKRHANLKEDLDLIRLIFLDPSSLDNPNRWFEETNLALTPRRYLPFHPHDNIQKVLDFNGGYYQRVLSKGATQMLYVLPEPDGTRLIWRDRSGRITSGGMAPNDEWLPKGPIILESITHDNTIHVYDAIFPRYPHLTLVERLGRLEEKEGVPMKVNKPAKIDKISELVSTETPDELLRFPDMAAFDPTKSGGFVLMTSQAKVILRLHSIRKLEEKMEVELSCIDGFEDFILVGRTEIPISLWNSVRQTLDRLDNIVLNGDWQTLPETLCVLLEVIAPSITKEPLDIPDAMVLGVRDDLGINDITQYVDFLHSS